MRVSPGRRQFSIIWRGRGAALDDQSSQKLQKCQRSVAYLARRLQSAVKTLWASFLLKLTVSSLPRVWKGKKNT